MESFSRLEFEHLGHLYGYVNAVLYFQNDYGVSVTSAVMDTDYEVAVLQNQKLTDEIHFKLSEEQVSELIDEVETR